MQDVWFAFSLLKVLALLISPVTLQTSQLVPLPPPQYIVPSTAQTHYDHLILIVWPPHILSISLNLFSPSCANLRYAH